MAISIGFFLFYRFFNSKAALKIESIPESIVYINDQQIGKTPIEIERKEREVDVKLVPEVFGEENISYSTKVELTPGVKTILRYKFGNGEVDSETLLVSFRRNGFGSPALAVVSIPDGSRVRVNGQARGTTPIRIDDLSENTYSLTVDAQGFKSSNFDVVPQAGYILTAFVDLASNDEETSSILDYEVDSEEDLEEPEDPMVYISQTPVGYLRVRSEALLSSPEIARVDPGEVFPLLSESDGWYEIALTATQSGFISSEYATTSASINN